MAVAARSLSSSASFSSSEDLAGVRQESVRLIREEEELKEAEKMGEMIRKLLGVVESQSRQICGIREGSEVTSAIQRVQTHTLTSHAARLEALRQEALYAIEAGAAATERAAAAMVEKEQLLVTVQAMREDVRILNEKQHAVEKESKKTAKLVKENSAAIRSTNLAVFVAGTAVTAGIGGPLIGGALHSAAAIAGFTGGAVATVAGARGVIKDVERLAKKHSS